MDSDIIHYKMSIRIFPSRSLSRELYWGDRLPHDLFECQRMRRCVWDGNSSFLCSIECGIVLDVRYEAFARQCLRLRSLFIGALCPVSLALLSVSLVGRESLEWQRHFAVCMPSLINRFSCRWCVRCRSVVRRYIIRSREFRGGADTIHRRSPDGHWLLLKSPARSIARVKSIESAMA